MPVRTRIAPSPTGMLHVGTARTALFNYLFSKHEKGEFLLRIEDTDLERSDKKYEKDIIEGLKWLGIEWDGEITRQSKRLDIYEKYLNELLKKGAAFWCFHSEKELENEKQQQFYLKDPARHICNDWRDFPLKDAETKIQSGEKAIIRFKTPLRPHDIVFQDLIRGQIHFLTRLLGDFSLAKNPRTPLYNFAVVVDDAEMEISHVIRGEDHISNTPKQILIAEALGFKPPHYAHLPLILGPDRSKLSKRHGATSVNEYKSEGYLPEALFNFLALLGWNPGDNREIFPKNELAQIFSLEKIQKAGAIFDLTKLDWMNGEYIRKESPRDLLRLAGMHLGDLLKNKPSYLSDEKIEKIAALEQPRLKKLSELPEKIDYFFKEPEYDGALLKWKDMSAADIKKSLETSGEILFGFQIEFSKKNIEKTFLDKIGAGDKGSVLWPLRIALTGKKASPGPFDIMEILGKETAILRINAAIDKLIK